MQQPRLVWPGKNRVKSLKQSCVHQPITVERYGTGENSFVLGDNLVYLNWLVAKGQKVDLIYIDPPFATNEKFRLKRSIGSAAYNSKQVIDFICYNDLWGNDISCYLNMFYPRLRLMYELLKDSGSIYVHVDYRLTAYVRLILDEIFGEDNFVNEIIWFYKTGGVPEKIGFSKKHDTILFYVKDKKKAKWFPQKEKSYLKHNYGFSNINIYKDKHGKYTYVHCRDVFDIPALRGNHRERIEYATQKPKQLLERIILASTEKGDVVADFFCGSGTTCVVAENLDRKWLACDIEPWAIHVSRKRILELKKFRGFQMLKFASRQELDVNEFRDLKVSISKRNELIAIKLEFFEPKDSSYRDKILHWSEWIDFWSIGGDTDTFQPVWYDFRTRFKRELSLETPYLLFKDKRVKIKIVTFEAREFEAEFVLDQV
ncbi:MAG: site-specific DNA-methyltransferase [Desulfonauticus sp.]|nr:site-specific DNA-methyltransferase [Desulfonauticus sp.]